MIYAVELPFNMLWSLDIVLISPSMNRM